MMRKDRICILVLSLLALAAPCRAQAGPGSQPNAGSIKPPQATDGGPDAPGTGRKRAARRAATPADTPEAKERQLWDAIGRGDLQGFAGFLADDALEMTSHGLDSKSQSVASLKGVKVSDIALSEFKTTMLDKDAILVTYRVAAKVSMQGSNTSFDERASTVWVKRGGKWLAFFHQQTPVNAQGQ